MGSSPNYYDILGVNFDASEKDILRAYRRKSLACHPDKNPDNPKAAELFIKLSEALEVLTDPAGRAAFDRVLKAKQAARLRTQAYDTKRKKFKDDLEQRESAAQSEKENAAQAAEQLAAQIKRLREEGSRLLREQQDLIQKQINEERKKNEEQHTPKLKVKWKASKEDHQNGGYNGPLLTELFEKYGRVTAIVLLPTKNGLAIIEFENATEANIALEFEKGLEENPLKVSWLDRPKFVPNYSPSIDDQASEKSCGGSNGLQDNEAKTKPAFDDDFENLVLRKMRQAEERKRLAREIVENDKKDSNENGT